MLSPLPRIVVPPNAGLVLKQDDGIGEGQAEDERVGFEERLPLRLRQVLLQHSLELANELRQRDLFDDGLELE